MSPKIGGSVKGAFDLFNSEVGSTIKIVDEKNLLPNKFGQYQKACWEIPNSTDVP